MFDINEYEDQLRQQLDQLELIYRRCFGVWCLQGVFDICEEHLSTTLQKAEIEFVEQNLRFLWGQVLSAASPSSEELNAREEQLKSIDMPNEGANPYADILTLEMLSSSQTAIWLFSKGWPSTAAMLGEHVINSLDADLWRQNIGANVDYFTVPKIAQELKAERAMLEYLATSPTLTIQDVHRFRTSLESA